MTHDRIPTIDLSYMHKHDTLSLTVLEYDDEHASDEWAWLDTCEPPSPSSSAIVRALMLAYPDKF